MTNQALKETLDLIEELLVRELRTAQVLLRLVGEEQSALGRGDVLKLTALSEQKEGLLDQFLGLEANRQQYVLGLSENPDADIAERLERLSEGIRVLTERMREVAQANRLLASMALQDAESRQAGLLLSTQADLPALCAALLEAREMPHLVTTHRSQPRLPDEEAGLVETMARLYHQEKAYRAVMQNSSRLIAQA